MSKRTEGVIPAYKSLPEILKEAIRREEESNAYYLAAVERAQNPELQRFLRHLAAVELTHKGQLHEQLEMVSSENAMVNDLLYAFGEPPL